MCLLNKHLSFHTGHVYLIIKANKKHFLTLAVLTWELIDLPNMLNAAAVLS